MLSRADIYELKQGANPRPRTVRPSAEDTADTATEAEMMAELDAIAATLGIVWSGAEVAGSVAPERTRYARPGQRCGSGYVRKITAKQLNLIKRLMRERDVTHLKRLPGSENIDSMSLKGASDLIDRLFACPMLAASARPADRSPAGNRTVDASLVEGYYQVGKWVYRTKRGQSSGKLYAEVFRPENRSFEYRPGAIGNIRPEWRISDETAASLIGPIGRPRGTAEIEDGVYLVDGNVYKVVHAIHGSGHQYAKRFNRVTKKFERSPGSICMIRPEHALSYDEAVKWGKLYGTCMVCGTGLTDDDSIAGGIGPVCARKRYGRAA